MNFYTCIAVGIGGFLGSLLRVGLGSWLPNGIWGTVLCNLAGCFLYGFLDASFSADAWSSKYSPDLIALLRLGVLGGFVGALTTFSTLIFETDGLFTRVRVLTGIIYLLVSLVFGFAALRLGRYLVEF